MRASGGGWQRHHVLAVFVTVAVLAATFVMYRSDSLTGTATTPSGPATSSVVAPGSLPRVPWAGPDFYKAFPAMVSAGWTDPNFFPIGVWYEAVTTPADTALDKEAGLNTYFELTASSDISLVRDAGMFAMPSTQLKGYGPETVGWLLTDEVDLWGHEGDAPWTGNFPSEGPICVPEQALCGYTVLKTLRDRLPQNDGRVRYANFGFGMEFFIKDPLAARFLDYTDVSSMDTYWYTDPGMCEKSHTPVEVCQRSASYGFTMDRIRGLDAMDGKLQPIYAFIETGLPFAQFSVPIAPDQLSGAVMNSLIHEARGVIYFNHNFGGPCISQHVLRDACGAQIRPAVIEINRRVKSLAPVLNTQSIKYQFSPDLDTMFKSLDGAYYIFAMNARGSAPGPHTLTLPSGMQATQAEVLFEDRTVPVDAGKLVDTFAAESTYHVYKLKGS
ncbi:hypothetical protein SAMN05421504_106107 [Amycolatopsis xylanica]|uniref:Beta-galactosidase n=1 Tax=Amycolatopsis xylanica TaxID=589385 RepID=A0A1H3L9R1_9PSEU|nr:hypothetical protein SAMN05421504_106107 [Amycolatopsis xylanica]